MICPACGEPMIVVERDEVEIDHCLGCGGVWFDRDELDHFLSTVAKDFQVDLDRLEGLKGRSAPKENPRKCPRCRKKMEKVSVDEKRTLILDRCRVHGGYWFDGGELAGMLKIRSDAGNWSRVLEFLGGFFAVQKEKEERA